MKDLSSRGLHSAFRTDVLIALPRSIALSTLSVCLVVVSGCFAPTPEFSVNQTYLVKWEREFGELRDERREASLDQITREFFGTPDAPCLPPLEGDATRLFNGDRISASAGAVASDKQGVPTGLYRKHCAHCHGVTGSGVGPTAAFLDPYPRDFRRGVFKFKSTPKGSKPTDEDLRRLLVQGIPGTAMPSYAALSEEELESLIQYVKFLSLRGEFERRMIEYATAELDADEPIVDEDALPETRQRQEQRVREMLADVARSWMEADSHVTPVPERGAVASSSDSWKRGRALFLGDAAGCYKCHGKTGRGDGQTEYFDDWANEIEPTDPEAVAAYRATGALPPRHIRPRNFRLGVFRGGDRPEDLYRRVRNGIGGTPMPETAVVQQASTDSKVLTSDDIWCLIDYVRSLGSQQD